MNTPKPLVMDYAETWYEIAEARQAGDSRWSQADLDEMAERDRSEQRARDYTRDQD